MRTHLYHAYYNQHHSLVNVCVILCFNMLFFVISDNARDPMLICMAKLRLFVWCELLNWDAYYSKYGETKTEIEIETDTGTGTEIESKRARRKERVSRFGRPTTLLFSKQQLVSICQWSMVSCDILSMCV